MAHDETLPCDFNKVTLHTNIVDRFNILQLSMVLKTLVKDCDVIAIDTEFTGLGDDVYNLAEHAESGKKKVRPGMENSLDERYESYSRLVREHALVSVGLTLFKKIKPSSGTAERQAGHQAENNKPAKKAKKKKNKKEPEVKNEHPMHEPSRYRASNFEFILFCQSSHKVSPTSLSFLVQNGFDLNRQVKLGIPYLPGLQGMDVELSNDIVSSRLQADLQKYNRVLRHLFMDILSSKAALVVHNGLLDLMFLYHSFYADLPHKLSTFVADISDWFESGGLFDTKCLSEFVTRDGASYLSFLFNKSLREQAVLHLLADKTSKPLRSFSVVMQPRIQLSVNARPITEEETVKSVPVTATPDLISKLMETLATEGSEGGISLEAVFCYNYMFHGNCKDNQYASSLLLLAPTCPKSHDLVRFLDASLLLAKKKYACASHPTKVQFNPPPFLLDCFKSTRPEFYRKVLETAAEYLPSSLAVPQANNTHSAQYDSFMTGYTFLHFLNHPDPDVKIHLDKSTQVSATGTSAALLALTKPAASPQKSYRNYLYLMGMSTPLLITKSSFSKCSEAHKKLWHLKA